MSMQSSERPMGATLKAQFLSDHGVRRPQDATSLALVTMLECYERALATMPKGSIQRAMVVGAFGKAPEIARKVLEVA